MNPLDGVFNRRNLLRGGLALGASAFLVRGAYAEELSRTPSLTEGPFYPPKLPLDTDNDLLVINDNITPAVGEVTHLTGRILTPSGEPMRNVVVEIWQCDAKGVYIAQEDGEGKDANFQGFGRFLTSSTGEYYFRTIKPVPYPGRTPHIHVKIKKGDRELLTTQLNIAGHPGNAIDGIATGGLSVFERELLQVDFTPVKGSKIGCVGYCMGGPLVLTAAGTFPDRVAAGASIHGANVANDRADSPHLLAPKMRGKIYVGVAEIDPWLTPGETDRLKAALEAGKTNHTVEIYPGVQHGFAGNGTPMYDRDASERHWERILALFRETLS